ERVNDVVSLFSKAVTRTCRLVRSEIRDEFNKLASSTTVIIGVSPDKSAAQSKFKDKFDLPFTLLSDVDHKVAEAYGAWVEKSMYGRKYMGMERCTFLIGPGGEIKKIFRKVKPDGHAQEVYEALQSA